MKIGLYFGSFNPIHVGHLVIANYLVQHEDLDQVWLVVSPHNPHKKKTSLLADHHRLALVNEAVFQNPTIRSSDIEFGLPQPNYTAHTLAHLKEKYPNNEFALILGEDNLRTFHKWFNYETILANHQLYVYPRVYTEQELEIVGKEETNGLREHSNVHFCEGAPVMAISSSYIREEIKAGKDVSYLLTPPVLKYIDEMNFYR